MPVTARLQAMMNGEDVTTWSMLGGMFRRPVHALAVEAGWD
jgi:hypothetical protein